MDWPVYLFASTGRKLCSRLSRINFE